MTLTMKELMEIALCIKATYVLFRQKKSVTSVASIYSRIVS